MRVVLLGAGNLGYHLATFLVEQAVDLLQIFNRTPQAAVRLSDQLGGCPFTTDYVTIVPDADLYIIAVKDDAIPKVAEQLTKALGSAIFIVHTSGAVSSNVLAPFTTNYGSFYPLQTFSKEVAVDFQQIPICLTADTASNLLLLEKLSQKIGCTSYIITDAQRKTLHIASVFACNFTNYLWGISKELLETEDLPYEIIHPLIKETVRKALINSPVDVQTGPAIRRDEATMLSHLEYLKSEPDLMKIYQLISERIAGKPFENKLTEL